MAGIAVLAPEVADQIAAGEVVERPASVVKELVENSIDAGATSIDISIEDGGRTLIRVADNGSGMQRDDAVLAIERHATSKLSKAEQLVGILSFGFRGEALPAIASVSQLELETAAQDGSGTAIRVHGGILQEVRDVARRQGTTVSVSQLFYNTPARRKFLRGVRSEWRAILDTVQSIAALQKDVHFTLRHDGKVALDVPSADSLRARLASLWGHRELDRFVDVEDVHGTVHVSGLAERPADAGLASRRVLLIVNGRVVRDHGIVRAAENAYRSTIPSGVRPSLVLSIQLSGADVDVNVHPAKSEIRLRDRWGTEQVIEAAVRRALGLFDASAGIGWREYTVGRATDRPNQSEGLGAVELDVRDLTTAAPTEGLFAAQDADGVSGDLASKTNLEAELVVPPLTQLRRTFIMYEHDEGVVLIDQHSAHERVLYERFMTAMTSGSVSIQRLLFPLTLHLDGAEAEAFEEGKSTFEALGFEIEGFGGRSLIVSAVPMPHPRFDAERCLRETLATLAGDRKAGVPATHERLAMTVACKSALKAGDAMSQGEMRALYIALSATQLPAHDVHGRATVVRVGWDELEKRFGRR